MDSEDHERRVGIQWQESCRDADVILPGRDVDGSGPGRTSRHLEVIRAWRPVAAGLLTERNRAAVLAVELQVQGTCQRVIQ